MNGRSSAIFPLVLVIGLALLSLWLEHAVREGDRESTSAQRHDPDFIIENFTTTETNAQGRRSATLSAQKLVHFPDDETSDLVEPRYTRLRQDATPIHVSARRGEVNGDGDEVRLYDDVVVRRPASGKELELRMETSYLQLFPDQHLARTPAPVVITEGASRLAGTGFEGNTDTGLMILKSRVRGTYVKPEGRAN